MSSKQTRRSTTTTSYQSSSGVSEGASTSFSASMSSSRRSEGSRPPSPARLSRIQEQEELQGLNDRLAAYIDKVRSLEAENSRLARQVRSTEEIVTREVTSVKTLYETELAELRRLLDDTSKEKARLQIEANKYKTDYEDLLGKFNKRDKDAAAFERRVQMLERQLAQLQSRDFEKEIQVLEAEVAKLEKQLAAAKKQLEDETLLRVDLQNRVKTLKEDLQFKSQVYEKELEESRIMTSTHLEEVDGRIEQEYEARLQNALREIREQHDNDMQSIKLELEALYETKIKDMRTQLQRNSDSSTAAWEELMASRKTVDELTAELNRLKAENSGLELRLLDMEKQLAQERKDFQARMRQREEEITLLRSQLEDMEFEYAALLEIKIKLDREIAAYNQLLNQEESRLNISAERSMATSSSTAGSSKKRRRMDLSQAVEEYSQRSSSSGFSRSGSSSGGIEITEVDTDGKFIKLTNTTDKDIPLFHYQLKHVAGDNQTVHKFGKNVLKAGQTVSIWSSDSDTTHNPPHDLLMKNRRWFVAEEMTTSLIDPDSKELATCTMSRNIGSVTSYSTRRSGRGGTDEVDASQVQDKDNCFIM